MYCKRFWVILFQNFLIYNEATIFHSNSRNAHCRNRGTCLCKQFLVKIGHSGDNFWWQLVTLVTSGDSWWHLVTISGDNWWFWWHLVTNLVTSGDIKQFYLLFALNFIMKTVIKTSWIQHPEVVICNQLRPASFYKLMLLTSWGHCSWSFRPVQAFYT